MKDPKKLFKQAFCTALAGMFVFLLLWVGQATFTTPLPKTENPLIFYSTENLDDLQLVHSRAILSAKKSILLVIYSLNDPKVIHALRKKAFENIPVTVICDAEASQGVEKRLGPKVETIFRKGHGLMHRKILVIDQQKVWLGSANMTTTSLKMHGNLVIGLDNPELANAIDKQAKTMSKTGQIHKQLVESFTSGEQRGEIYFLPENPVALKKLRNLIQTAQKTIKVAMFTWTRHDLADDIIQASKRGVITEIAIDRSAAESAGSEIVKKLSENGIAVRLSQGEALLHHKMMVVDDSILVNGSANWTKSAFDRNEDCFIVLYDLSQEQQNYLKSLWKEIH